MWHVLALVSTAYAMVFVLAVQLAQVIAMRMCSWPLSPRSIALPLRRRHVTRQQSGDRSAVDVSFARLLLPLCSLKQSRRRAFFNNEANVYTRGENIRLLRQMSRSGRWEEREVFKEGGVST